LQDGCYNDPPWIFPNAKVVITQKKKHFTATILEVLSYKYVLLCDTGFRRQPLKTTIHKIESMDESVNEILVIERESGALNTIPRHLWEKVNNF
jgi:hypothetical protein